MFITSWTNIKVLIVFGGHTHNLYIVTNNNFVNFNFSENHNFLHVKVYQLLLYNFAFQTELTWL